MELVKSLGCRKGNGKKPQSWALYLCPYCGNKVERQRSHGQRNKSCGCAKNKLCADAKTTHGDAQRGKKTRLYKIWCKIIERCNNPNSSRYQFYGAKGIKICQEWGKFIEFKRWAESSGYGPGLEIDRENSSQDYSPSNCRWVTRTVNNRNRSMVKLTIETARAMRQQYAEGDKTVQTIANTFNVSKGCAADVLSGRTWKEEANNGYH